MPLLCQMLVSYVQCILYFQNVAVCIGLFVSCFTGCQQKNTLNLFLFKRVSQELLMVFLKKVKIMNGGVY